MGSNIFQVHRGVLIKANIREAVGIVWGVSQALILFHASHLQCADYN